MVVAQESVLSGTSQIDIIRRKSTRSSRQQDLGIDEPPILDRYEDDDQMAACQTLLMKN